MDPADYILAAKLPVIHDVMLAACDNADGVADGVINDPTNCRFKPATLNARVRLSTQSRIIQTDVADLFWSASRLT